MNVTSIYLLMKLVSYCSLQNLNLKRRSLVNFHLQKSYVMHNIIQYQAPMLSILLMIQNNHMDYVEFHLSCHIRQSFDEPLPQTGFQTGVLSSEEQQLTPTFKRTIRSGMIKTNKAQHFNIRN